MSNYPDGAIAATGEVIPLPRSLTFEGWVQYDPANPDGWSHLSLASHGAPYAAYKPQPHDGLVVRRVVVTIPLDPS